MRVGSVTPEDEVRWNTLSGPSTSSPDPRTADGWVSEDPEPPPPPQGTADQYERDASGRMVYVPRGFYYDAVLVNDQGERVKVEVGVVGARRRRTFVLRKVLSRPSDVAPGSFIVDVTMERPLGVPYILNPEPSTLDHKLQTRNLTTQTPHPPSSILHPELYALNPVP